MSTHVAQEFVQRAENLATLVPKDETSLEQFKKVAHDALEKVEALLHIDQTKELALKLLTTLTTACTRVAQGIRDRQHFPQAAKDEFKLLSDRTQALWKELLSSASTGAPVLKAQAGLDQIRAMLDQALTLPAIKEMHARLNDVIALIQSTMPSEARLYIAPVIEQLRDITTVLKQKFNDARANLGEDASELCHEMLQKIHSYASAYAPALHGHVQTVTDYCNNNEKVKAVRNAALTVTENPIIRDQVKPELWKLKSEISTEIYSNAALKQKLIVIAFILLTFLALTVKSIAGRLHEYATTKVTDLKSSSVSSCTSGPCTSHHVHQTPLKVD